MKPIHSPLKIFDFAVTRMDFQFHPTTTKSPPAFEEYEIDIDFKIFRDRVLQVVIDVDINTTSKPLPGYSISAEVTCLFEFDKASKISADEKRSIEGFSTIYMALNSLRGLISSFTANAPFGRYVLPSLDLNDLIQKKRESVQAARAKTPPGPPVKTESKKKTMAKKT
jgi:hypothetical protein